MGSTFNETMRLGVAFLRLPQHPKNLRAISTSKVFYVRMRHQRRRFISYGDDCENFGARPLQGGEPVFLQQVSKSKMTIH